MNVTCDLCGRKPGENELAIPDGDILHICHKCWDTIAAIVEVYLRATTVNKTTIIFAPAEIQDEVEFTRYRPVKAEPFIYIDEDNFPATA